MTETIKLVVTVILLRWSSMLTATVKPTTRGLATAKLAIIRQAGRFGVPAALYCVSNNLTVVLLLYVPPTEAIVLGQLRVLFTAMASRWLLGTRYSTIQVTALVLL